MPRVLLTVATAICLLGVFRVYSLVVTPLLRPISRVDARPPVMARPQVSSGAADLARQFLPNAVWAQEASLCWQQSDDACIFSNDVERLPDGGNKVRMAPYAMVWRDAKRTDGGRYTIEAEGAVVHFQNAFFDEALELGDRKPGRIVHVSLEGKVRITGPDNLAIEGEKFIFSEESAQLYSDWPVTFRYGPSPGQTNAVRGQADQVTIEFAPAATSAFGPDMPRVGELARLRLRRAVQFDMTYELNGQMARTLVTSDGPFVYDIAEKRAEFEENVSVVRPQVINGAKHLDSLKAAWLGLQFVAATPEQSGLAAGQQPETPKIQQASGTRAFSEDSLLSRIQFRYLRALSQPAPGKPAVPVHLESTENRFTADMQDLRYDAFTREVTLLDPKEVRIRHDATQLYSPAVRVIHGQRGQQFESIDCEGAGHFEQMDAAKETLVFFGSWTERVHVAPDPESKGNILSIIGGASLVQPEQVQIDGETIRVWLDDTTGTRLPGAAGAQGSLRRLPVKRAVAQGSVQMATRDVIVRTNSVDAAFSEGTVPPRERGPQRGGKNENPRSMPGAGPAEPPLLVHADRIEARIVRDPATQEVDVPELIGREHIRITREAPPVATATRDGRPNVSGPIEINGHQLHMRSAGGTGHVVTLAGFRDPNTGQTQEATLRVGDYRVESGVLIFDRGRNLVEVPGPGQLHLPVSTDVRGKKLGQPQIMDVAWVEKMTFDGQTAKFLERVKTRVGDSQLTCEAMNVALNRRIDFQSDHPDTTGLDLKTIDCRHNVTIEMYEYADARIVEVMKGNLAEFHLDNETGEFEGLGPGEIQDWRLSKGESSRWLSVEPTSTAQTNQPAREDKRFPWEYVQLVFKGNITGNTQRQDATLRRNVQILYAPVAQALQVFERNDLSADSGKENGENGAWLGCRELDVVIVEDAMGEPTARLKAQGGDGEDAALEGRKFTANGHEVLYDQAKDQFILRGRGKDKADIHFQDQPGQPPRDVQARVIEFVPTRRSLILDGATFNGQAQ